MENVDIMYNLYGFLVDEKAQNIQSDISKNEIYFTKDGKDYILKLTKKQKIKRKRRN